MRKFVFSITTVMVVLIIMASCMIGCQSQSSTESMQTGSSLQSEQTRDEQIADLAAQREALSHQIEEMQKQMPKPEASFLAEANIQTGRDRTSTSYDYEINYPRNWKEISEKQKEEHCNSYLQVIESQNSRNRKYRSALRENDSIYAIPETSLSKTPVLGRYFENCSSALYSTGDNPLLADLANVTEDEVWVIVRPPVSETEDDDRPGGGAMLACFGDEEADRKPLPLKHTDVKGRISGYIAAVDVTQQFHNPYAEKIEAVYVFPLPQNAAVNEFIMTVGTRKIRGIIRERQEAEQIYQQARRQGYTASLLTQERPNIFTQKVANIEPGKSIDVTIRYFNTLAYVDGWYEFVFPMVVGPRFNPPQTTDGVGAVAAGQRGISGQSTEVQYLKPHERSGHDIALTVDVNAGVQIEKIDCPSHAILKTEHSPEVATVTLDHRDSIPNKDFILRYKVAGRTLKHSFISHTTDDGSYFTLMLYPPQEPDAAMRVPMEMIFVIDCSGSMSGEPIAKAKDAVRRAIKKLDSNDTFQVIRFSSSASQLGVYPLLATPENIRRGLDYVDNLEGGGGTMMIEGIKAALDFPHDPTRLRLVSFMTDGFIGNEAEILAAVYEHLGSSRIFSFGVGSSVNRYLLDRMAKLGRGAVAYIGLEDDAREAVDLFYDRIRHPALTDVAIDWGGLQVSDVYPSRIPDIFPGRPVILTGRYASHRPTDIRVIGKVGEVYRQLTIPVLDDETYRGHEAIRSVWARKKIEQLNSRSTYDDNPELKDEIRDVALGYGLMSAYTAFIAVDSSHRTDGDHGVTIAVPVPVPDGVRYDTTVQQN